MNKHWDYQIPSVQIWEQVLRVLKPGGHLLCACGTRTQHRMVCNIEDAGFEIRDVISWIYGSGFPKSLDISKAIDKAAGVEREVIGTKENSFGRQKGGGPAWGEGISGEYINPHDFNITAPATDAAKQWEGWGTALKPATEFWTLARKPISENTIAENVLKHGTGGLNIDGSRIEYQSEQDKNAALAGDAFKRKDFSEKKGWARPWMEDEEKVKMLNLAAKERAQNGRFPANVIFDEFTGQLLDQQSGELTSGGANGDRRGHGPSYGDTCYGEYEGLNTVDGREPDSGGASRFFYCPKADNFERNKGLKGFEQKEVTGGNTFKSGVDWNFDPRSPEGGYQVKHDTKHRNNHPTVKPIDLMRYLVKLITPKHGICIDPFCGSGTTLIGCKLELIKYIGIDTNEEYCKIAEARVAAWNPEKYIAQTLF